MKQLIIMAGVSLAITSLSVGQSSAQTPQAKPAATKQEKIEWLTYDAGLAKAKAENKPIIIDFTASWCGWCKKMERETFSDPKVIKYMRDTYVPIKVWGDDTTKAAMVSHNGERMTQQRLSGAVYGVRGYPTFWFLDSQGGRIGPQSGYRSPNQFLPLIEYVGGSHYKTMSYDSFVQKRNGKG
ncbi:MAG: thioredoxin fold domain-containing protein [Candidatus Zixiibacteriota bacterium]